MGLFRGKRPQPILNEPCLPTVGERVTVRVDGGTRLWVAAVQTTGDGVLGLQLEVDAYHEGKQDMILSGDIVHVAGLGGSGTRVRAETRGHNGSMLLLKSVEIAVDRPTRILERIETKGKVRFITGDRKEQLVDVFDLSLGGICVTASDRAHLGDVVSLVDPAHGDVKPVRGVVVGMQTSAERGDVIHIAFVAGTPADSLAKLSECLTMHDTTPRPPTQSVERTGWAVDPNPGRMTRTTAPA
jgi:hypothetical protein